MEEGCDNHHASYHSPVINLNMPQLQKRMVFVLNVIVVFDVYCFFNYCYVLLLSVLCVFLIHFIGGFIRC